MKSTKIFTLFFLTSFLLSCNIDAQNWPGSGIRGEGPKVTKSLDISTFDGVGLTISADFYLTKRSNESLKMKPHKNIIDNLKKEVKNGVWKISFQKNVSKHDGVKIWITMKDLSRVAVSGSGSVTGENRFKVNGNLSLAVSGSGDINLDADSENLDAAISGSGDIKLGGRTGACKISIAGSGDVTAFDLATQSCEVRISGSGDASVQVEDNLEVAIAGSGDVYYKGNAKVRSKISGSGDVISK